LQRKNDREEDELGSSKGKESLGQKEEMIGSGQNKTCDLVPKLVENSKGGLTALRSWTRGGEESPVNRGDKGVRTKNGLGFCKVRGLSIGSG